MQRKPGRRVARRERKIKGKMQSVYQIRFTVAAVGRFTQKRRHQVGLAVISVTHGGIFGVLDLVLCLVRKKIGRVSIASNQYIVPNSFIQSNMVKLSHLPVCYYIVYIIHADQLKCNSLLTYELVNTLIYYPCTERVKK